MLIAPEVGRYLSVCGVMGPAWRYSNYIARFDKLSSICLFIPRALFFRFLYGYSARFFSLGTAMEQFPRGIACNIPNAPPIGMFPFLFSSF
jgi:hypothetical protein